MTKWNAPPPTPRKYTDEFLAPIRALWEGGPEPSAAQIAERFAGMTKNTVIGQAHRRGWRPRREPPPEPSTIYDRLAAHHAKLDRVLAETRPWVEGRKPVMVAA